MSYETGSAAGVTWTSDNIFLLNFTTTPCISQPLASSTVAINPFNVFNYLGTVTMNPASDDWYDSKVQPIVKVNAENENNSA